MKTNKSILIFGTGPLQQSLIERCKEKGLFTVGIDPNPNAECKESVDAFEVVAGDDFEMTLEVARKYKVSGIITAATDKPLVMMAKVANALSFTFFSLDTATISTDKFLMKEAFQKSGIPCAQGKIISNPQDIQGLKFPLILKPRDNSGSRGVIFCKDLLEVRKAFSEVESHTKKDTILVEEFVEGREFSIESLHYNGKSEVIQFTEKKTTEFPYNVELGHIQPANITENQKNQIREIIALIAKALNFENCPSHTELKINDRGIFIIETSPRLGGDYITSTLTPLSTGINLEDQLLRISLGDEVDTQSGRVDKASGVRFFNLPLGIVKSISLDKEKILSNPNVVSFSLDFKEGDEIKPITSSLNRYGQVIVKGNSFEEILRELELIENIVIANSLVS